MHRSIFAILCVLALPSCDPAPERTDADARRDDARKGKHRDSFEDYRQNHAQFSAEGSVGRPPPPRNMIAGVGDICPVHHQKMTVREVPIVFEESADDGTDAAGAAPAAAFPFAAEKVISAGNSLLPGEALTARIYQCTACIIGQKAAKRMRSTAAPPVAAE